VAAATGGRAPAGWRAGGETPARPAPEPLVGRAPLPGRRIAASLDDDLFEDAPVAFDRFAGARR